MDGSWVGKLHEFSQFTNGALWIPHNEWTDCYLEVNKLGILVTWLKDLEVKLWCSLEKTCCRQLWIHVSLVFCDLWTDSGTVLFVVECLVFVINHNMWPGLQKFSLFCFCSINLIIIYTTATRTSSLLQNLMGFPLQLMKIRYYILRWLY